MAADIVTLDEAKKHLDIAGVLTGVTDDEELDRFIRSATATAAGYLRADALVETDVTDRLPGGRGFLNLPQRPVLSVQSVTDNLTGQPLTVTDWWVEPLSGRYTAGPLATVACLPSDVTVAYTIGWPDPTPEDIRQGVLELVRHQWETQRGRSTGRAVPGYDEDAGSGLSDGYGLPNRVKEALAPHRLVLA